LEHEPAWRIQLCGRVAIERAGERLESGLTKELHLAILGG
jgi:hypothetical protein